MSNESLQKLVAELDVLIRARYSLIAANTHEEGRFRRVMHAVAQLKCHREKDKGLYLWSRTTGLRQTVGKEVKGKEEVPIPETRPYQRSRVHRQAAEETVRVVRLQPVPRALRAG